MPDVPGSDTLRVGLRLRLTPTYGIGSHADASGHARTADASGHARTVGRGERSDARRPGLRYTPRRPSPAAHADLRMTSAGSRRANFYSFLMAVTMGPSVFAGSRHAAPRPEERLRLQETLRRGAGSLGDADQRGGHPLCFALTEWPTRRKAPPSPRSPSGNKRTPTLFPVVPGHTGPHCFNAGQIPRRAWGHPERDRPSFQALRR